jgi:hypothetical protein
LLPRTGHRLARDDLGIREARCSMETPETLRAEIDHYRRLAQLVTDEGVRAEIEKLIEGLERRLRELEKPGPSATARFVDLRCEIDVLTR